MKRSVRPLLFAFVLLMAMPGLVLAADLRIGVVNVPVLFEKSPQARDANQRLQKEFAGREQAIAESQKDVKEKEERLARDSAIMSESERRKLERDVLSAKRELKRAQEEFREDVNIRRNEEFGKLQRLVYRIIVDLAKEEGYDLILGENVLYAADTVDITPQVLERLEASGAGAGAN